jgi:AcrB/AcrD/AcrF family
MVPIGTVADVKNMTSPYRVPRYNLSPAAEVQGVAAPGVATGTALHRMEELAAQVLPPGIGFAWTETAFLQQQKGTPTALVFGAAALFVFLYLRPCTCGEIRKLEGAARGRADCADVPARFCQRPDVPRHAYRYPGADRLRGSGRARCQECHTDRGVRASASGEGRHACRGNCLCSTDTPTAHSDDVPCLYPGSRAPRRGNRGVGGDAAVAWHGCVWWHAGCHGVRVDLYAGVLHARAADKVWWTVGIRRRM